MNPKEERKYDYKYVFEVIRNLILKHVVAFVGWKATWNFRGGNRTLFVVLLCFSILWGAYTLIETARIYLCLVTNCLFCFTFSSAAPWDGNWKQVINSCKIRYKKGAWESFVLALKETPKFAKSRRFQWQHQEYVFLRKQIVMKHLMRTNEIITRPTPEMKQEIRQLAKKYGISDEEMML